MFNILADDLFIYAHGAYEVAVGPNTVCAPIDLFEEWELGLQRPGGICFDDANDLTDSLTGWDRHEHVEVVLVRIDLFEDNVRIVVFDSVDLNQ